MRYLNIILIIIFSSSLTFAQYSEKFIQEDEYDAQPTVKKVDTDKKKVFTNIAIGTSIMSSGKNNYALNTYVNPTISYQLTPKFSVSMGLMAVQSNYNNFSFYNYEGQVQNMNYSGTTAYFTLQGAYQLSEKLRVYGGVMLGTENMDFAGINIPTEPKNRPKAYQVGFEYKIGEHASLQFEFQMRDSSPMQNMQMQSARGFGGMGMGSSSMFGPRMGAW